MRINLIPPDLRPAQINTLPYVFLAAIVALAGLWAVSAVADASFARRRQREYRTELQHLAKELSASEDLERATAKTQEEYDALRVRAAFVTALTHLGFPSARTFQALAQATPEQLRLTEATFEPSKKVAVLLGYGDKDGADIDLAALLRALNASPTLRKTFTGVTLNSCTLAKQGESTVKKFSISMQLREGDGTESLATN